MWSSVGRIPGSGVAKFWIRQVQPANEYLFACHRKFQGLLHMKPVGSKTREFYGRVWGAERRTARCWGGAGWSRTGRRRVGSPRGQPSLLPPRVSRASETTVLLVPAPPRRPTVRRPVPTRVCYVRVLDSKGPDSSLFVGSSQTIVLFHLAGICSSLFFCTQIGKRGTIRQAADDCLEKMFTRRQREGEQHFNRRPMEMRRYPLDWKVGRPPP